MDAKEVERLRKHIIRTSIAAVMIVILILSMIVNVGQAITLRRQVYGTLNYIAKHEGSEFLGTGQSKTASQEEANKAEDRKKKLSKPLLGYNPFILERLNNSPYFTVALPADGKAQVKMSQDSLISRSDAVDLAREFLREGEDHGSHGFYFYAIRKNDAGDAFVAVIDYQEGVYSLLRLFSWSLAAITFGLIVTYLLLRVMSKRMVRPMVENSRRQRQFITNASHELKTPLAVIRSNTELMEMLNGESEWTQSTLKQVDRLNGLVQNLVMIARSQEQESDSGAADADISAIVEETAEPFDSLAETEGLTFTREIEPEVHLTANGSSIRTLTSVLVDNAIKYCDEGGSVGVKLTSGRKTGTAVLTVSNSYAEGGSVDYSRFFERFYREDQSHHVDGAEKKGFGIGLSLAQNLTSLYGGRITAGWKDGIITFTCPLASLKK